jgi:hypothetical protein
MRCRSTFFVRSIPFRRLAAAAGAILALCLAACDIGSVDSTTRSVSDSSGTLYDFSGLYIPYGNNAQFLVHPPQRQSGAALTWLRLLQYGSSLEAYDNAGQNWAGQISSVQSGAAAFTLRGRTSAGVQVDVAGALRFSTAEDAATATMDATWIEPGFSGSILARATVSPPSSGESDSGNNGEDDNGATGLTVAPEGRWFISMGGVSGSYSVSGGTPPYTWEVSDTSLGTLNPTTGETVTYTTTQVPGTNYITVTDSAEATGAAYAYYQ